MRRVGVGGHLEGVGVDVDPDVDVDLHAEDLVGAGRERWVS